jgi:hypothetical protein
MLLNGSPCTCLCAPPALTVLQCGRRAALCWRLVQRRPAGWCAAYTHPGHRQQCRPGAADAQIPTRALPARRGGAGALLGGAGWSKIMWQLRWGLALFVCHHQHCSTRVPAEVNPAAVLSPEPPPAPPASSVPPPALPLPMHCLPQPLHSVLGRVQVVKAVLFDMDVVYAPLISSYGSATATLEHSPGTAVEVWLTYLTPQLQARRGGVRPFVVFDDVHDSTGRGVSYRTLPSS